MRIGTLPNGARGFDANQTIHANDAAAAVRQGYQFAVRYVRRSQVHDYDLSVAEIAQLLGAGLGLMVVQHVAPEGWAPSEQLGLAYGAVAAEECRKLNLPAGVTVWCDLEGVQPGVHPLVVTSFCNAWHHQVAAAGYEPGLYVGWHCGLSPAALYQTLRFTRYWSAYNLNAGEFPAVRGVQMRQSAAHPADLIPGFTNQTMDVNVIQADALGGTPLLLLP